MWIIILEYLVLFVQLGVLFYSFILTKRGNMTAKLRKEFSDFSWTCTIIICGLGVCYIILYII